MAHRRRANKCNVILNTEPPRARENRPLSDGGIKGPGDLRAWGSVDVGLCQWGLAFIEVLGKRWLGRLSNLPTWDTVTTLHELLFV